MATGDGVQTYRKRRAKPSTAAVPMVQQWYTRVFLILIHVHVFFAEREEWSDEDVSESEESNVEDLTISVKSRKRKITSSGKKAKKPRLRIPKKSARKRRAQEPPGPPPKRPRHKPKASQIASKISYNIIGSEQAHNTVQNCTYKNASILMQFPFIFVL